ncbi:hypothetical protein GCM10009753_56240 [Streptantibioticus ferralitis]
MSAAPAVTAQTMSHRLVRFGRVAALNKTSPNGRWKDAMAAVTTTGGVVAADPITGGAVWGSGES